MFRRPARSAGSAAKSATAATIRASASSSVAGWKALGVGVASRFDIGSSSSGAISVPGDQAEQPGGERERGVLGHQQARRPRAA